MRKDKKKKYVKYNFKKRKISDIVGVIYHKKKKNRPRRA